MNNDDMWSNFQDHHIQRDPREDSKTIRELDPLRAIKITFGARTVFMYPSFAERYFNYLLKKS